MAIVHWEVLKKKTQKNSPKQTTHKLVKKINKIPNPQQTNRGKKLLVSSWKNERRNSNTNHCRTSQYKTEYSSLCLNPTLILFDYCWCGINIKYSLNTEAEGSIPIWVIHFRVISGSCGSLPTQNALKILWLEICWRASETCIFIEPVPAVWSSRGESTSWLERWISHMRKGWELGLFRKREGFEVT